MNLDKAIAKVRNTNWTKHVEAKLVNELEELFNELKYVAFKKAVTRKDVVDFFVYEDTQQVALNMIFG